MKILKINPVVYLVARLISFCLVPQVSAETPDRQLSIQIVFDNSAALRHPKEALEDQKKILNHIQKLRKRSETRTAKINLISINNPRNLWVGTPQDLRLQGKEVLSRLNIVENGCADIKGAFEQIRTNIKLQRADEVRIYIFSSLIHTGAPCDDANIVLPQQPPELDLSFVDNIVITKFKFYWVNELQVKIWLDYLEKAGITKRWEEYELDFSLYDEASTKTELRKGL